MHSHTGEFATRGISRKTTTQGFRMPPLGLYARARIHPLHCARDRRCSAHPAFPAPSRFRGRTLTRLGRLVPRDREVMCFEWS